MSAEVRTPSNRDTGVPICVIAIILRNCDKPRRSSEKVDPQQFPERYSLRTRWTVPIDGATLALHSWFLNALRFAAARPRLIHSPIMALNNLSDGNALKAREEKKRFRDKRKYSILRTSILWVNFGFIRRYDVPLKQDAKV